AAGAVGGPEPSRRTASHGVCAARAGRSVPGTASDSGRGDHYSGRRTCLTVAVLAAVRLQSAAFAKPEGRISRNVPRTEEESTDGGKGDGDQGPGPRRCECTRAGAIGASGSFANENAQ